MSIWWVLAVPRFFWMVSNAGHIYIPCLCHDADEKFPLLSERDSTDKIVYEHWVFEFGDVVINLKSLNC